MIEVRAAGEIGVEVTMMRNVAGWLVGAWWMGGFLACSGIVPIGANDANDAGQGASALDAAAGAIDSSTTTTDGSATTAIDSSTTAADGSATIADATTAVDSSEDSTSTTDGAGDRDAGADCSACTPAEICVAQRSSGGALILPDDSGACPPGRQPESTGAERVICQYDWAYSCQPRPAACAAAIDCACAPAACSGPPASNCSGQTTSTASLECTLFVP